MSSASHEHKDAPTPRSSPRGRRLQSALARVSLGAFIGGILGGFDVCIFLGQTPSELTASECSTALVLGILLGTSAGSALAMVFGGTIPWLQRRVRKHLLKHIGGSLILGALIGIYIDATQYVNLYPTLHWALGIIAFVSAIYGGLLLPLRGSASLSMIALVLVLATPFIAYSLLNQSQALAQILMEQTTITGRNISLIWSAPDGPSTDDCQWPDTEHSTFSAEPTGHSVLLITVDAWRADIAEHHLQHAMPRLAERAQKSVYFSRAYAASTRTHESVYSLMTGTWPHRLTFTPAGVDQNDQFREIDDTYSIKQIQRLPLHDRQATLAQTLSDAQYATAAIIPYVFFMRDAGITRGFRYIDERAYLEANKDTRGVTSPILTDQAIKWISQQKSRWMTWIHYLDPHNPYIPFGGVSQDAPMKVRYASELRRVDTEIDRLLTTLEDRGALENTWVVIASDHGEEFKDHGGFFHGATVYEELARVPLFIFGPTLTPARIDTPVSLIDLMPTILELVGIKPVEPTDGRSIAKTVLNRSVHPPKQRPLLITSGLGAKKVAILQDPFKYIFNDGTQGEQLFNLADDPRETRNLIDHHSEIVLEARCLRRASGVLEAD